MSHDTKALRSAFGTFPTGVTVVTSQDSDGNPVGFTANSFTSVSLDPPLLLVCPSVHLSSFSVFETCSHFAVNILAEGQEAISNRFAGFKGDRFAETAWSPDGNGLPLLKGCAARFSCATEQVIPAGDHIILLGKVEAYDATGKQGLGYVSGQYFSLGLEKAAAETCFAGRRSVAGVIAQKEGCLLLKQRGGQFSLPKIDVARHISASRAIEAEIAAHGISAQMGPTYSVYDGVAGEHFIFFLATVTAPVEDQELLADLAFHPLDTVLSLPIQDRAEHAMLQRFVSESGAQSFGFYVGDSAAGYVHPLHHPS